MDIVKLRDRIHARAGTLVAILKIQPGEQPRTVPERDGSVADRFMRALRN